MRAMFHRGFVAILGALIGTLTQFPAAAQDFPPKPLKEHKVLEANTGTWDANLKMWTDPNADPAEWTGVETNSLLPGGLWLITDFKGELMGMDFHGHGQTGYDPNKKKYVGTWVDSFGPWMMNQSGDYDEKTRTLTMIGEGFDPNQGKVVKYKSISVHKPDGSRSMTMSMIGDDGKETKMLEISYTKKK